jgi:hypothetical protein
MINSQETAVKNVTVKIIAPDTHQLLRSLRAIESLTPLYFESAIHVNEKDDNMHVFLTLPLNWFKEAEQKLVESDNRKYAVAELNSQEQPCKAEATPVNRLTEVN